MSILNSDNIFSSSWSMPGGRTSLSIGYLVDVWRSIMIQRCDARSLAVVVAGHNSYRGHLRDTLLRLVRKDVVYILENADDKETHKKTGITEDTYFLTHRAWCK